jgi:uncharacterized protein YecE (DUF72 family)
MMRKGRIYVGTSGWHYGHWKGPFYAPDCPQAQMLPFYAGLLRTVEINSSFYHLPAAKTFGEWRMATPEGFVFAVKASRYITHMKKLKDPREPLALLLEHASALEEKLGPILFQLPPRWRCNPQRLKDFLAALPSGHRYAFEFRDESWFDPRVYEALSRAGAAFCIFELAGLRSPREVTADFVYIRLHGPDGAYQGEYGKNGLAPWAAQFSAWARQGRDVYCYFDNDQAGYAARDALLLKQMLGD